MCSCWCYEEVCRYHRRFQLDLRVQLPVWCLSGLTPFAADSCYAALVDRHLFVKVDSIEHVVLSYLVLHGVGVRARPWRSPKYNVHRREAWKGGILFACPRSLFLTSHCAVDVSTQQ